MGNVDLKILDNDQIQGVILTPLKIFSNEKGSVFHAMKYTDPGYNGFQEAYFSGVSKGEVKGWKKHKEMTLNLVVIVGSVQFILYDDRIDSPNNGQICTVELSRYNYYRLTVPPNVWVSFSGKESENILLNLASLIHDPKEAENIPLDQFPILNIW